MIAHIKNTMNTSCGPYWHMVYRLQLQFISTCGGIDWLIDTEETHSIHLNKRSSFINDCWTHPSLAEPKQHSGTLYWMIWKKPYPPFHWQHQLSQLPRKRRTKRLPIHWEGSKWTHWTTAEYWAHFYSSYTTYPPLPSHTTYFHNDNFTQEPERDQDEHTDFL